MNRNQATAAAYATTGSGMLLTAAAFEVLNTAGYVTLYERLASAAIPLLVGGMVLCVVAHRTPPPSSPTRSSK